MGQGTLIDYKLKLNGIPFGWRTRIAHWDPPYGFVDEQLKGPYSIWHHTHTFADEGGGRGGIHFLHRLAKNGRAGGGGEFGEFGERFANVGGGAGFKFRADEKNAHGAGVAVLDE